MKSAQGPLSKLVAKRVIEILPPIVHKLRSDARAIIRGKVTLPQFRILANVYRGINNVSAIAEVNGVAQPTMSKMIDGLVTRGFMKRKAVPEDRRQYQLELTAKGQKTFLDGKSQVEQKLARDLSKIEASKLHQLEASLSQIQSILVSSLVQNTDKKKTAA